MSKIIKIEAFELYDSRANPTVAVKVFTEKGGEGFAIVPSGASTGMFEAHELRDGGLRLGGKGVKKAVEHVKNLITPALLGHEAENTAELDRIMLELDGTENKERLGANAILGVSVASAKAAANEAQLPLYKYLAGDGKITLPRPMMNILNGGAHASNNIDIQEFMIQPVCPASFSESMEICTEIYHALKAILKKKGLSTAVGDEGGFAPDLKGDEAALELLSEAIIAAGYSTEKVKICLDAAASEWYRKDGIYRMPKRDIKMDGEGLVALWERYANNYPIASIEDGIGENDFENFSLLTKRLGDKIQLVGDDLFVTNEKRFKAGLLAGAANAILIKPNQIGTLSETLSVIKLAQENGYSAVISHRSGESEDTFIADLAVGVAAGQIKTGAPARSERVAKYNRLLMIEKELQ
ncbi:MAG: phosphopyruvate hydratase [Clostridia bacterium]|nr:phosphopyruvate hydratase [Clostridia bacterium]